MRIGETFKKAAGLFVEMPDEQSFGAYASSVAAAEPRSAPRTVADVVREQPGPDLDQIQPTVDPAQPVIDASGHVRYDEIYKLAALPSAPLTAEQVLEILNSLPTELPIASKRATVKVTIDAMSKTMSVTTESIVADASRKLAALAAYTKSYTDQATQYTAKAEAEIASLEAQIAARKASIDDAKARQQQMVAACTAESDRLDDVLEFFTLDVGPSRNAPGTPPAGS